MTNLSILNEIPEVVREKVQRALRNMTPLSDVRGLARLKGGWRSSAD